MAEKLIYQRNPKGLDVRMPSSDDNWNKKRVSMNMDGARLIEACADGGGTVAEITGRYNAKYPERKLPHEKAVAFFKRAALDGLVKLSKERDGGRVEIKGSATLYYPQHMSIELTSRCNYRCKHCYRGSSPDGGEDINFEKLMKFLDDFSMHGGSAVEFTGGEPMLNPKFFEIINFAVTRFPIVAIITNGYLLDEAAQRRLLPYKEILKFNISLDSHLPEYHNRFRGKSDAYEHTVKNLEALGKNGFMFRVAMSITHENYMHLEETLKLAKKLGATKFVYSLVQDVGRGEDTGVVVQQAKGEFEKYMAYEQRIQTEYKDIIHFVSPEAKKEAEASNCGIIQRSFVLGPEGELRPCVMFDASLRIGNIYKQPFEEIFGSGLSAEFTKIHAPKESVCGKCEHLALYCKGCILKGIKRGRTVKDCPWLKQPGIAKYFSEAPVERSCANYREHVCD
ncbi:MAG: hypothetical protein A2016_00950 [Elusimicrobia bacterium GWF2_62_30]|nr:MAG: hypothetical protein A2016_00950 [Elusimicrobia bacterium GWF2_62_30]